MTHAEDCTGLTARYCPNHGDCTCPITNGVDDDMDDDSCSLHNAHSPHPEAPAGLVVFS